MADIEKPSGLDWVKLREDMGEIIDRESGFDKFIRKSKENPLVPIGTMFTVGALTYGLASFVKGDSQRQQKFMRLRVAGQMFTVVAAVGGILYSMPPGKRSWKDLIEKGDPKAQIAQQNAK